jgi:hypothetical protein
MIISIDIKFNFFDCFSGYHVLVKKIEFSLLFCACVCVVCFVHSFPEAVFFYLLLLALIDIRYICIDHHQSLVPCLFFFSIILERL